MPSRSDVRSHGHRHGINAFANQTTTPVTLQQVLEQSMTADQLAQLSPQQLTDLQNQVSAVLNQPFHPYMGYYEAGALPHDYAADLQPPEMAHMDIYPANAQYQQYEGLPPVGISQGPPQADRDTDE